MPMESAELNVYLRNMLAKLGAGKPMEEGGAAVPGALGYDPRVAQSYDILAQRFAAPGTYQPGGDQELKEAAGISGRPNLPIPQISDQIKAGGLNEEEMRAIEALLAQSMNALAQRGMK